MVSLTQSELQAACCQEKEDFMLGQQTGTVYRAAIYCRFSKDDGKTEDSSSIATQREMLSRYVREQGWTLSGEYVDDGYTGLNFNRPEFKRMIADIEDGKINCVITKDLSRLGRDHLGSGMYQEIFFPEHSVRYIAIDDGVDSLHPSGMDITPFKNLLNEMYSKDISKKVKSAKKTRLLQGKFLGASAPFGYVKDPEDKNHLIIDERTAPVVRRIFELAKQGWGISRIRQLLTNEKVLRPAACIWEKGGNYDRYFVGNDENRYVWSNNSVRGILRNPVYAGHLAGYKRPIPSMKSKKRLCALPEDWLIVRDTHEPLIPPKEWELVQELITSRRLGKPGVSGYDNIFSGIVKCATCGYAMRTSPAHRTRKSRAIENMTYICNSYGMYGKKVCTAHVIEATELYSAVLEDIRRHAKLALNDDEKLLKRIMGRMDQNTLSEMKTLEKERKQIEKRLAELDRLFAKLYEDRTDEKISERNYISLSSRYEQEQNRLDERLAYIKESLAENREVTDNAEQWVSQIKEYAGITELSVSLLHALIERVTIEEAQMIDGERCQTIHIYYKFIGCIE